MKNSRVILIILDSVGIGALPDAALYKDEGSNTLLHIAQTKGELNLPNLQNLGLGNITSLERMNPIEKPQACYGKLAEISSGKDTTTGHWELMGIVRDVPFPVYPNGFPPDVIEPFQEKIGSKILGNKPASGTDIIKELGKKHIETQCPIVYTSADSVFQISAHEDIIPIEKLYEICSIARNLLTGKHSVGRVIARPFIGIEGSFTRTKKRKDFSLTPPSPNLLDRIIENNTKALGIGKISDIFAGKGISSSLHIKNNKDGIEQTISAIQNNLEYKLIFTNLIDFDMLYGHRNDIDGYYNSLKEFDSCLPDIMKSLNKDDILIITADHGCDPTILGTDHTREYVPILIYGDKIEKGINLNIRSSFSDVGQTLADLWQYKKLEHGESFLNLIKK